MTNKNELAITLTDEERRRGAGVTIHPREIALYLKDRLEQVHGPLTVTCGEGGICIYLDPAKVAGVKDSLRMIGIPFEREATPSATSSDQSPALSPSAEEPPTL